MNDSARQILSGIVAKHGRAICDSPKRVKALLRDLSPGLRRETNIIVGALDERIAADLILAGKSVPRDVLFARLIARLRDNFAYTPEAARWAVETWAVVLGVMSESELDERARVEAMREKQSSHPIKSTAKTLNPERPHVSDLTPKQPQPNITAGNASSKLPPPPTPLHPPQTKPTHTVARPPAAKPVKHRAHAPKVNVPATPFRQNNVPAKTVQPQTIQPQAVKPQTAKSPALPRRGMTLRGCFLAVLILAVITVAAVFIVPAIIVVLQEEQAQPSINEPRIK